MPNSRWKQFRDHQEWLRTLPDSERRAYHKALYKAQIVALVSAVIGGVALILHLAIVVPICAAAGFVAWLWWQRDAKIRRSK